MRRGSCPRLLLLRSAMSYYDVDAILAEEEVRAAPSSASAQTGCPKLS